MTKLYSGGQDLPAQTEELTVLYCIIVLYNIIYIPRIMPGKSMDCTSSGEPKKTCKIISQINQMIT